MAQSKREKLDKIYDTFEKHGVDLDRDDIWEVQGTPVVYHKAIERLGAALKVRWNKPDFIRKEKDEAVIYVEGVVGDRMEWSIGEALVGVNYRVSGRQSAYVWAMAEKRAKDRVILKLADLHGEVYSDEEADEFKKGNQRQEPPARQPQETQVTVTATVEHDSEEPAADPANDDGEIAAVKKKIDDAASVNAVTDIMLHQDTQKLLGSLDEGPREELRDYAKARLAALGWPAKKTA